MACLSHLALGKRLGRAASRGDARKAVGRGHPRDDITIVPPACTARGGSVAQSDCRSTQNRNLLQFACGEESDPLAVGREKWINAAFGSRQRSFLGLVEQARREQLLPIGTANGKYQTGSVGRDGGSGVATGDSIRPEIDAEAHERMVDWAS